MIKFSAPIRGAHFHPPAKEVLASLPAGAELVLQREPNNAYDPNAIQVFVPTWEIPESCHESLAECLPGYGLDLEEVLSNGPILLGYVGKEFAERLAPALAALEQSNSTHSHADFSDMISQPEDGLPRHQAHLTFDAAGKPQVQVEFPEEGGA